MKIEEVKKVIAYKKLVNYKDMTFTVNSCTLRLKDGKWYYTVELQDLKANSVIQALMENVEVKE